MNTTLENPNTPVHLYLGNSFILNKLEILKNAEKEKNILKVPLAKNFFTKMKFFRLVSEVLYLFIADRQACLLVVRQAGIPSITTKTENEM